MKLRRLEQWVTDFQRFGKTNMDFAALQQKLFDLDPSDRAEDLRRLSESVGGVPQESVQTEENFLQESVEVQQGTMPVEGDYSLSDFAALAGVTLNESQKTGSAGQLKGKDPMPKAKARGKHPHVDKLVGEADDDLSKFMDPSYTKKKSDEFKKWLGATPGKSKGKAVTKKSAPAADKKAPPTRDGWKGFLKQHTAQLQKISADPKKRAQFDQFMSSMAEGVEEGDGRKKGVHGKGHPMRKKQQAAIHAGESVESIKEMLYRKLNSK